jgi:probable F420-dependent oxidoreductase
MRPFRFGVQIASAHDGPGWRAKAKMAEELGFSTIFVPDHINTQWGPLVAMTVAAEATTTLRVGSLVLANDFRHPVLLAKEIATLDLVSGGRVELGIGAGWLKKDYQEIGLPLDPPAERIERLAECVLILKDLWSAAASRRSGEHYNVNVRHGMPVPCALPHPPIIIGGGGRKILSLAAREADIVGINPRMASGRADASVAMSISPKDFADRVAWTREAAGARWDSLELQCLTLICRVTKDRESSLRAFSTAMGVCPEVLDSSPAVLMGTIDEICETLLRRREELGLSYWVVHEQEMRDFAVVVARLRGR